MNLITIVSTLQGFRTDFHLDIIELKNEGLTKGSRPLINVINEYVLVGMVW